MMNLATKLFPLWAILLSALAYGFPALFTPLKPSLFFLLGLVMFGMGISLKANDFLAILKSPKPIFLGLLIQFLCMPFFAWALSSYLQLPLMLATGMVLVGASPGGTASNVICYLAKANVALSITITTFSTLLAVVMTPLLSLLYLGKQIDVPAMKMLLDIVKIIILPVTAGLIINHFFSAYLGRIKQVFPLISVFSIVLIIAIIVALNQPQLGSIGILLVVAVALHNALGLIVGYWIPCMLGMDKRTCKTLAIEVGMQNSGLAVALAVKYFAPAAALAGALFSLWHNLSGSLLAAIWSRAK
ncbi:MAG: bile acid:sodium symporter family protein [Cycloclasticus sp.]|nr:bile acid:sodium symporter family protein [Cycloclasticus sp.]MBQ0790079.1 bile acid:sodium symporter family protein [Cycloclasticus sp.]